MANPQTEHGYTRVANELLEAVLMADLGKREQKVVWAVIRQTYGYNKKEDAVSTHQIANLTGLDRSHVARCLRGLTQNGVILTRPSGIRRHGIEVPYLRINKDYSQWQTGANSAPVQTSSTDAETAPVETEETGAKTARVPKQHGCQNSTGNGCQIGSETGAKTAPSKDSTKDRKTDIGASAPTCPHDEVIELYHELLPMCPPVRKWHDTRKAYLRARWREDTKHQSLDFWRQFFGYVAESRFLTGQVENRDGKPPFCADLEWLIKPTNFAKVIEGKYHNG